MTARTDMPGIYKEKEGVLINKDNEGLRAYKARKQQNKKINEVESDLNELKADMHEIKTMLRKIVSL